MHPWGPPETLSLLGNTLLLAATALGAIRQASLPWFLLCFWAVAEFAVSALELAFALDWLSIFQSAWLFEVRAWTVLIARASLVAGLVMLALRSRAARTNI